MSSLAADPRTGARTGHGWQLILADLALILFLLTLSALPATEAETGNRRADRAVRDKEEEEGAPLPEFADAQALFRPVPGGPALGEWLAAQAPDPRATLTVVATHTAGGEAQAWARAQALAAEARARGTRVRIVITAGSTADITASLAYDAQLAETGAGAGREWRRR
jgi:hypothetical protein